MKPVPQPAINFNRPSSYHRPSGDHRLGGLHAPVRPPAELERLRADVITKLDAWRDAEQRHARVSSQCPPHRTTHSDVATAHFERVRIWDEYDKALQAYVKHGG